MTGLRIRLAIFVVTFAVIAGAFWFNHRGTTPKPKPTNAKVGDCLHQVGITSVEPLACDDAIATYRVVGRVEGKLQAEQINTNTGCDRWPETTTTYWEGTPGSRGSILCLARVG